jgi:D-alanine-D-alanine ligase
VARAIRALGYDLIVMGFQLPLQRFIQEIEAVRPYVVFNFTESVRGDRRAFANVAAVLDLMDIPYTGSGATALALTMDKALTKQVLAWHGIPVPKFFVARPGENVAMPADMSFPLFVKPLHGGGKEAISLSCIVTTEHELRKRLRYIYKTCAQPAICEQYIDGRELTLAITGNEWLSVCHPREVLFDHDDAKGPRILTERILADRNYRKRWNLKMRDAVLTAGQIRALRLLGKAAYKALGLRGYARFDLRMSAEGTVYVIEANANPALRRPSQSFLAPWGNKLYEQLIERVIRLGVEYHGARKKTGSVL